MKQAALSLAGGLLLSLSFTVTAATFYVNVSNPALPSYLKADPFVAAGLT